MPGWRESDLLRFGCPTFPARFALIFEIPRIPANSWLRRTKKGGDTNSSTSHLEEFWFGRSRRTQQYCRIARDETSTNKIIQMSGATGSTPVSLHRHIRPKRKFALTRDSKMFTLNFISFTYQSDMLVELYHRFPIMSIGKSKKF